MECGRLRLRLARRRALPPRLPPATRQPLRRTERALESVQAARINNWTVGIAAGLLEGSFIRFASELGKALDDGENLRILPMVTYGRSKILPIFSI